MTNFPSSFHPTKQQQNVVVYQCAHIASTDFPFTKIVSGRKVSEKVFLCFCVGVCVGEEIRVERRKKIDKQSKEEREIFLLSALKRGNSWNNRWKAGKFPRRDYVRRTNTSVVGLWGWKWAALDCVCEQGGWMCGTEMNGTSWNPSIKLELILCLCCFGLVRSSPFSCSNFRRFVSLEVSFRFYGLQFLSLSLRGKK